MSVVEFHPPLSVEEVGVAIEAFERATTYRDLYDAFVGVLGPHWLLPVENDEVVWFSPDPPAERSGYEVVRSTWIEQLSAWIVAPQHRARMQVQNGPSRADMMKLMYNFAEQVYRKLGSVVTPEAMKYFADKPTLSDLMTETLSRLLNLDLGRAEGFLQNKVMEPLLLHVETLRRKQAGQRVAFIPSDGVNVMMSNILTATSMLRRAEETAMPGVTKRKSLLQRPETSEEKERTVHYERERARMLRADEVRDRRMTGEDSIAMMLRRTGTVAEEAHGKPSKWLTVCQYAKELLTTGRLKESEREHAVRIELCRAALGVLLGYTAGDEERDEDVVLFEDTGFITRGLPAIERHEKRDLLDVAWTLAILFTWSYPIQIMSESLPDPPGQPGGTPEYVRNPEDVRVFTAGMIAVEALRNINGPPDQDGTVRTVSSLRRQTAESERIAIDAALGMGVYVLSASDLVGTCIRKTNIAQDIHITSPVITKGEMATAGIMAALILQVIIFAVSAQVEREAQTDDAFLSMAAVAGGFAAAMVVQAGEEEQVEEAVEYVRRVIGNNERAYMARPLVEQAVLFARGRVRRPDAGYAVFGMRPQSIMLGFLQLI